MEVTPSKLLSLRLEKLEKDLQLLAGLQTLIMSDGSLPQGQGSFRPPAEDYPERDTNTKSIRKEVQFGSGSSRSSSNGSSRRSSGKSQGSSTTNSRKSTLQSLDELRECKQMRSHIRGESIGGEGHDQIDVPQKPSTDTSTKSTMTDEDVRGNLELLQAFQTEQRKRRDVEDSAKIVAIKLQQTEEELKKERETKQMLLVGTLQLKNQISGQNLHLQEREAEFERVKEELGNQQTKLSCTITESGVIVKKFKDLISSLKAEKKLLHAENRKLVDEKKVVVAKFEETRKESAVREQSVQRQEHKHVVKLNQMATKCAQVDKERQELAQELKVTMEKLEQCEVQCEETKKTLQACQAEAERSSVLKDCLLEKLQADMNLQKRQFELQIKSSQTIVSKTKALIIEIKGERDELRKVAEKYKKEYQKGELRLGEVTKNYQAAREQYTQLKEKMKVTLSTSRNNEEKLKKETLSLKCRVKTLEEEKQLHSKLTLTSENEFLKEKTNLEEKLKTLSQDSEDFKNELSRCTDNFRVLQKVSEDQTKTINALRSEKEEQRKVRFSLETQIRERDANETALIRKLDQEQRKVTHLEHTIEGLEKKVSAFEAELREHNCEEFVESKLQRQISEIESEVKEKYDHWEESLRHSKTERDKALRDTQYHKKVSEDTKTNCESRLLEITSKAKQDLQRLKVDMKRSLSEKDTRVMELEGLVEQQKMQAQQMQKTFCNRIQQLQCALNACVSSAAGPGFPNSGIGGPIGFSGFM